MTRALHFALGRDYLRKDPFVCRDISVELQIKRPNYHFNLLLKLGEVVAESTSVFYGCFAQRQRQTAPAAPVQHSGEYGC